MGKNQVLSFSYQICTPFDRNPNFFWVSSWPRPKGLRERFRSIFRGPLGAPLCPLSLFLLCVQALPPPDVMSCLFFFFFFFIFLLSFFLAPGLSACTFVTKGDPKGFWTEEELRGGPEERDSGESECMYACMLLQHTAHNTAPTTGAKLAS